MDRVELAFRKFDINKDGYLSREEFDIVSKAYSFNVQGKTNIKYMKRLEKCFPHIHNIVWVFHIKK